MNSTCQDDSFLRPVVFDIVRKAGSKVLETRVDRCEGINVVLKEALDLFFKGCMEESLDVTFAVLTLLVEFLGLLELLFEPLFHNRR